MFVCVLLVAAIVGRPSANANPAAQAAAPTAVVTIAHFNDVYEIGPTEGGKAGGLARVATIIDDLKRRASPLLVTLGGDYVSPSALGIAKVDGAALNGKQMVDVLNHVGLQWATLGNHEFDIPEADLRARLTEAAFKTVVANVTDVNGQLFPNTTRTAITTVKVGSRTIRIGLFGLCVDSNRKAWVKYQDPIASAKAAVAELAGKTDAIVAITHLALSGDAELVKAVPEIDIVIGGHEHENWIMRRGAGFTPVIKADANVRSLAVISMTFGAKGARPTISSRLQVIDDHVKAKPAVESIVNAWTDKAFAAFRAMGFSPDSPVVTLTRALDGREATVRNKPGELTQIIANAMQHDAGAELGIFNSGSVRIDDVIQPGPLKEYDIIRILPFGGKVLRVSMDGALIARVLDTGLGNQGTGGYLHSSDGMVRDSTGWTLNGVRLDPAKAYVVGISDFLLTGLETNLAYLTRTAPGIHSIEEKDEVGRAVIDEMKRVFSR